MKRKSQGNARGVEKKDSSTKDKLSGEGEPKFFRRGQVEVGLVVIILDVVKKGIDLLNFLMVGKLLL